ncbi:Pr6Pr family membrane protein [Agriterribacter sp.]|uniref:Pr6Pr family membrane protein n=1 Tax=Agriterribacter sp. TaxID=2821509 RepID=UPI002C60C981|nr:Pr6Pr family membrane protein [Agriterribacter sp.]HTN08915.1 Pr6Pr family membrane protein [Agriterribacter sp.]
MNAKPAGIQIISAIGAVMAWTAVMLQLYLIMVNRLASVPETLLRFFTFFTILCNILAAVCFTALSIKPRFGNGNFFSRPGVLSAVTIYIAIVGIVYQLILRPLWDPQGLQKIVDELLHSVMPAYCILFWHLYVPKLTLRWQHIFRWLVFPLCYLVIILLRGAVSGYYPYPFVNVSVLGYGKVFLNCGMLLVAFLFFSVLVVAVGRFSKKHAD